MADRTFYLTTPIYYVNARPHLGHSYATIAADAMCRYRRLRGDRVYFLTGTDEHGERIAQVAGAAGMTPQAYADQISRAFRETWQRLHREGDRGRQVPRPPDGAHLHQGEELLLQDVEIPGLADQASRGQPGLHPARAVPERGAGLPARAAPGPLDQPAESAPPVGHSPAVRRPVRDVRLVRRADQLRLGARVPRWGALQGVLAACRAPDRQGHPQAPRRLLADHAQGGRDPALQAPRRPRL